MNTRHRIVVFTVDEQRYGLPLHAVERVVPMVDVTALPAAPEIVLGVMNVQGRVIPVLDLRRRLRRPRRNISIDDQIVVVRTTRRSFGLIVDAARGVLEYSADEAVGAHDIVPGIEQVEGVVKLADGLVLIHDLEKFLSLEEESALDRAIEGG